MMHSQATALPGGTCPEACMRGSTHVGAEALHGSSDDARALCPPRRPVPFPCPQPGCAQRPTEIAPPGRISINRVRAE